VYVGLMKAESKSVFFYDNIRDVFACTEVISPSHSTDIP
jgi:hypothetical protein